MSITITYVNFLAQGDRPAGPGGPPKDFIMEISVDGSKYTFTSNTPKGPRVVVYEDGKETEHTGFRGETLKVRFINIYVNWKCNVYIPLIF